MARPSPRHPPRPESFVGRMPPTAGSVMNSPVVHPPTNTRSSSTGASRRTTASNSARFGSATEEPAQPRAQLPFCQLPLTRASVAQGVNQRQELVERRVLPGGFGRGLVQWLEGRTAHLTIRSGRRVRTLRSTSAARGALNLSSQPRRNGSGAGSPSHPAGIRVHRTLDHDADAAGQAFHERAEATPP